MKLGAIILPIIGITNEQWSAVAAAVVATALWGIEALASWVNRKRLQEAEPIKPEVIE